MRSTRIVEWHLFERNGWLICCPLRQSSGLMFLPKYAQTREMPCRLPIFISRKFDIFSFADRKVLIRTWQERKSSSLIGSVGPDYLQPRGRNQSLWSLQMSLGRADSREWVILMLVHKHHSALFFWIKGFFQFWDDVDWDLCS